MGVDWERRFAETEKQDAGRGLGPDPVESQEPSTRVVKWHLAEVGESHRAALICDFLQDHLDPWRFDVRQTATVYGRDDLARRRGGDLRPGREPVTKRVECAIGVHVRGVLAQDSTDQDIERWSMGSPLAIPVPLTEPRLDGQELSVRVDQRWHVDHQRSIGCPVTGSQDRDMSGNRPVDRSDHVSYTPGVVRTS